LILERVRLGRALARVPVRVAVAGTRGKSSVTRLIAAGLRASGARVLAKTTGSKPVLIFPDGTEAEIPRVGMPSIREQVRLVSRAARIGADALVVEMMSIGEECLRAESGKILRPRVLALTNVRADHLDAMGADRETIARTLTAVFPENGEVLLPAEELRPVFERAASRLKIRLVPVPPAPGVGAADGLAKTIPGEFEPNRRLARAVLASLGIDDRTIEQGFAAAAPDAGSLRIWRGAFGEPPRRAFCVSLFAANEPESSAAALLEVERMIPLAGRPLVGLLSLREDRGDRTLQWVRAAGEGFFRGFSSVFLIGPPARAALRKVRRRPGPGGPVFSSIEGRSPEALMTRVLSAAPGDPVVVGLGNFVGRGEEIARYWELRGTAHAG